MMMKSTAFGLFGLVLLATACSQAGTHDVSANSADGTSAQGPGGSGGGTGTGGGQRSAGGASLLDTLNASDRAHVEDEVDSFSAMVGSSVALRYRGRLVPGYT